MILLVGECVVIVLVILCPQYLGINLEREDIQDSWQRNYGVPGREQYTAAIDLVQTKVCVICSTIPYCKIMYT